MPMTPVQLGLLIQNKDSERLLSKKVPAASLLQYERQEQAS